jgi:predicted MFS family arabinose efflux permease
MTSSRTFRSGIYAIEGLNSFATVIYFNYLYFYFRDQFGFDNQRNLELASGIGLVYALASWQAGKFAARFGCFTALKGGFGLMALGLLVGSQLHNVAGEIVIACLVNIGTCLVWPTLEALVSEGADAADAVGLYNITWAATNAFAYFIGGTLLEKLGYRSIFYVPFLLTLLQLAIVVWLQKKQVPALTREPGSLAPTPPPEAPSAVQARSFKYMGWLANPFAYIGINTLLAVIPGVAAKFHLSPMMAGFTCSLWCFVRLAMFGLLWVWTGWHYRFRWLATAGALLALSFGTILVAPNLAALIAAQVFFGAAIGLIYYSSLFYSMDASDTKSEHGGIHEAAIGMGNCIGPAVGAASLQFLPQVAHSGAIAVSALLLCGFGGLFAIRRWTR